MNPVLVLLIFLCALHHAYAQIPCQEGEFTCDNRICLKNQKVCDKEDSCGDNSDETFCHIRSKICWEWQLLCENGTCINGSFQCDNGRCINTTLTCDKHDHCGDGTDERRGVAGFKCPMGRGGDSCSLPRRHVTDSFVHCNTREDVNINHRLFRCLNTKMIVSSSQQCDGVVDCQDLSDECPCENSTTWDICTTFCTGNSTKGNQSCTAGTILCDGGKEVSMRRICDGIADCEDQMDEKYCSKHSMNRTIMCPGDPYNKTQIAARLCDGRLECFDLSDECAPDCANFSDICSYDFFSTKPYFHSCTTSTMGTRNLTVNDFCDGRWSDCSPRIKVEERKCPGRFYCKSGDLLSIDLALKCDGYSQCDKGEDEEDCPDRYMCDKGRIKSVPLKFVLDGVSDCQGGADECPRFLDNQAVASRKFMIAEPFFQVWIWIVGFSAIFGNTFMIIVQLKKYSEWKKSHGMVKCNHFILINLAVADFLMGIYLLGISTQNVMYTGNYCKQDARWRSSTKCVIYGVISVISCEASVFMLTLLTTFRLISVYNPIKARDAKVMWAIMSCVAAWAIAIILAVVPVASTLTEWFIWGAWIPSKFITSATVDLTSASKFARLLRGFALNGSTQTITKRWSSVSSYLRTNFRGHAIKGYFGYYSEHSVCLPNFYVTTSDRVWQYSFLIILLNFLVFVYIILAYVAIYRLSTRSKIRSTVKRNINMQNKIIRLVVTDFMCWAPVCIIAFLHFNEWIVAGGKYYSATAIMVLPINSVINPLLYSDLYDKAWKKMKTLYEQTLSSSGTDN